MKAENWRLENKNENSNQEDDSEGFSLYLMKLDWGQGMVSKHGLEVKNQTK